MCQLVLTSVRNQHLRRNLGFNLAHALEVMQRQVFDRPAALRANNVGAPAKAREAVGQASGKGIGGIAPQVMLVAVNHVLLVGEGLDRALKGVIRGAQQKARHGEANISCVFALPETLPFGKLRAFEMVPQILQVGQPGEAFQAEETWPRCSDKGRVGHAGDAGCVLHQFHIGRTGRKKVIGNDRAHWLTAELTVFGAIDVLV